MGFFDIPIITKIRRNHGLEHATVYILSQRNDGKLSIIGRSDWNGFTLYGTIETETVEQAVHEALKRLHQGEADLAVHPRCGTVLAATGFLTGLAAFLAIGLDGGSNNSRFRWSTIPAAILAATIAAIFSQPLGLFLQEKYTVTGLPGNLKIKSVTSISSNSSLITHRIETEQEQ